MSVARILCPACDCMIIVLLRQIVVMSIVRYLGLHIVSVVFLGLHVVSLVSLGLYIEPVVFLGSSSCSARLSS